jgi:hypothetical protein
VAGDEWAVFGFRDAMRNLAGSGAMDVCAGESPAAKRATPLLPVGVVIYTVGLP